MEQKVKVGDTFRVFEVIDISNFKGHCGIEINYDKNDKCQTHEVFVNNYAERVWFSTKELKQIGTIIIKSLK
jgi:hypothetical protein